MKTAKKINEENLFMINKKIKRVPNKPKNWWENNCTTVKKLKEIIANLPDETILVVPGIGHEMTLAEVKISSALFSKKEWCIDEDFGEEMTPESIYGTRKQVLVIE